MQQMDDPPYLSVGTEVSAKYKGAFCEAKVRKVVRNIKCKVAYKQGLGSGTVSDDQIKGDSLRVGSTVEVKHPERREFVEATITKIQDCSQYTVVFDDGDITTLRRSALCLKSGRHFNESETLDQLPLTHPEHFGNPVMGGRRGARRSRPLQEDSSDDDDDQETKQILHEKEEHIGKVVCVENSDTNKKKAPKENWFPGLVVAPQAQDTVRIRVKDEYLVRSFKDGRYYTVPKKEATEFTRAAASKQDNAAVQAALEYLDRSVLPPHWDRDVLFGLSAVSSDFEQEDDSESSDDEPREEKDHFVAQLYKYMDDRGTPLNKGPSIINRDVDLYRLGRAVQKLGGYNRVTTSNQWKSVATRLGFAPATTSITNLVKQAYKKFVQPFEDFNRKLGCTMVAHPRANRIKGRSLVRANSVASPKPSDSKESGKPSTSSSITADESENNSESETDEPVPPPTPSPVKEKIKRKLSAGTSGIKVKTLVDKYEEKIIPKDSKESSPDIEEPPIDIMRSSVTPPTSRPIVIPARRAITPPVSRPNVPPPLTTPTSTKLFKSMTPLKDEKESKEPPVVTLGPSSSSSSSSSGPPILPIMRHQKIPKRPDEKRGRKKKDNDDKGEKSERKEGEFGDFPIDVGDKLKVFYHAQKVTYEAKVIEISVQSGVPVYLVHYTGWNIRYDEWVPKERIAENLTNSKTKRSKPGTPKSASNSANTSITTPGSSKSSSKRGRGSSRSDSQPPRPRSTTPSSVASNSSRTKSPATPAQRRTTRGQTGVTRRTSNNTDISSILTESDTDSDEPVISKKSAIRTNSTVSTSSSSSNTSSGKEKNTSGNGRGPNLSDDGGPSSKGRDYDLNQIRSELKGFKKLKSPSPETDIPLSTSTDESDRKSIFDSPDNKRLLQHDLKKGSGGGGDDTSDAKTSSDVSSETDSTADDDSQSSTKAVGKTDKVLPFNKFDKTKSQILEKTPVKNLMPERIIPRKMSTNEPTTQSTVAKIIDKVSKVVEKETEKITEIKLLKEKEIENEKEREKEKERDTEKEKAKAALHEKKMERAAAKVDKKTMAAEKSFSRMNISEKIKATDKIKIIEKTENVQKFATTSANVIVAGTSLPPSPTVGTTTIPTVTNTVTTTPVKEIIKKPLAIIEDESSIPGDIYEFKEPEPFEFEAAGSKPKASTLLDNEKKAKKQLHEMSQEVVVKPIIPVTKRVKKSPIKEPPEKIIKLIKKEDPIVEEISSLPMISSTPRSSTSADLFDVLRKSPNFNMNANSLSDLSSPIDCKTNIFMDEKFLFPEISKTSIKIQPIVLDFTKADPPKLFEPISAVKDELKVKDDFKEMEVVQRILSPQPLVDIEPPKPQDKPSIADKVLKALTQQSQLKSAAAQSSQPIKLKIEPIEIPKIIENIHPPIPEIKPIEALVLSPIITTPPPKIELSAIVKKDLEISIKKNVFNSPEHDILESISPKNNDLSETIQKLESVIQKSTNIDRFAEDSTDSTDSEQRLVIEDESQSSETNLTQQEFICINKKENDANYGTRRDLSKEKCFTKTLTESSVKDDLNFVSKFQENLFGIQRPIDKQQMFAVDFLTTGMIEAELKSERLHKEKMESFDNAQTQHILHNESLSMLLCEETIPESPAPSICYSNASSGKDSKDLEHMKKVMDGLNFINTHPIGADIKPVPMEIENDLRKIVDKEIVAVGMPQSSPSINSISQDDSKSDSEDLKKQENEKDPSPMKRRRQRKTSECDSNLKRRKTQFRKSNTTNGTDSEDNSDPINIRTASGPRTPKPCQYNFLVSLDAAMSSNHRITLLKKKIQELRKTYNMIKVELASIDRRRKKLRRREREKNKLAKSATS